MEKKGERKNEKTVHVKFMRTVGSVNGTVEL